MSGPLLFEALPGLASRVPWLPLASVPTPVEAHTVTGRPVLVKRDDLTARPYGGNKVRKLEFLLAEARGRGANRVITAGAFGSHHALATAVYGPRAGLAVTCVLFPQPLTAHVRDVLGLIVAQGAEVRCTRRMEGIPLALRLARWRARAEPASIIPPGGSNPTGALGYVEAGLELAAQIGAGACPEPAGIYVAAGTLGTAAGLAVGLALAGRPIPIHAVRITRPAVTNVRVLRGLVRGILELLRPAAATLPTCDEVLGRVTICHDQIGPGYGRETAAAFAATAVFGSAGLKLDVTYTAKTAAALLDERAGARPPLFWHTLSARHPVPDGTAPDPARVPERIRRILGEHDQARRPAEPTQASFLAPLIGLWRDRR